MAGTRSKQKLPSHQSLLEGGIKRLEARVISAISTAMLLQRQSAPRSKLQRKMLRGMKISRMRWRLAMNGAKKKGEISDKKRPQNPLTKPVRLSLKDTRPRAAMAVVKK